MTAVLFELVDLAAISMAGRDTFASYCRACESPAAVELLRDRLTVACSGGCELATVPYPPRSNGTPTLHGRGSSHDVSAALAELERWPQWVGWRYGARRGDKREKAPHNPSTGRRASVADPTTWTTYAEACAGAPAHDGIGFVLTAADPYVGIDLDACRDPETGSVEPWAQAIVERLASYTEVTPSGRGLRVWVRGTLPAGGRRRGRVEMYDRGRFFTVTGQHLAGTPTTIEDRQAELAGLHAELFGCPPPTNSPPPPTVSTPVDTDDDALLTRARAAENGAKFAALWRGEWDAAGHPSQSEADLALAGMVAYWTGGDAERVDRLFRRSGLMRPKWDEPHAGDGRTYGEMTIAKALAGGSEHNPARGAPEGDGGVNTGGGATDDSGRLGTSLLTPQEWEEVRAHEAAIHDRDFVLRWVAYGESRTDAPVEFHRAAALALVATAIDRNRWLALQHKAIYPSIDALLLAGSGQRKSTPLGYAESALVSALPDRVLANDYSPEALIADLSGREPSRGTAFIDEAGRLLGTMRRERYGEGLKDLLAALWDAPERMSRRLMKGPYDLRSAYVSVVMATTLSRFTEVCTAEDVASGFLARFLPAVVVGPITRKPLRRMADETETAGQELGCALAQMRERLAQPAGPIAITDEAIARLDEAERELEEWVSREFQADLLLPWARRLAEYGSRLAVIFAVSEGADEIERLHVLRALAVIDRARRDALVLVEELVKGRAAREMDKVERFIRANPGISGRELQRRTGLSAARVDFLTRELEAQGRIVVKRDGSRYTCHPADGTEPGS